MKRTIIFFLSFLALKSTGHAQCVKEISTNPNNPVNNEFLQLANEWYSGAGPYTVNSFLNQWSWYPPDNNQFTIDLTQNWANNMFQSQSMTMDNPFVATGTTTFIHQQAGSHPWRDFRWEDGWELMWMNLGIHPNLDQAQAPSIGSLYESNNMASSPLPNYVPYFVLYNRYRGVMRMFANVWQDNLQPNAQEVMIGLRFDQFAGFNDGLSGLLRHSINYDTPLDQPTSGVVHFSPRMHATNAPSFLVADFQMGFDPCICLKQNDPLNSDLGKLEFDFMTFQTMNINMTSRSISIDAPITAASFTDDFYNMSEINTENYEPGHRIYTTMQSLYDDYIDKLEKYNTQMAAQNDDFDFLEAFMKRVAPALTNTFVDSWTIDEVVTKLKDSTALSSKSDEEVMALLEAQRKKYELNFNKNGTFATKTLQALVKGILGIAFDYLNLELFPKKSTPVKPTTPVATFTETLYKGQILNANVATSSQLYQPGGVTYTEDDSPIAWGHGIVDLDFRNMPAYNKVLGQAALLRTPKTAFFFETDNPSVERYVTGDYEVMNDGQFQWLSYPAVQEMSSPLDIKFRVTDNLQIALNNTLDFDLEQTNSYISLEVELTNRMTASDTWTWWDEITDVEVNHSFANDHFHVTNYLFENERLLQLNSIWKPLTDVNQFVFSCEGVEDITIHGWFPSQEFPPIVPNFPPFDPSEVKYEIQRVKIKVLHDMYFDQVGSFEEQNNSSQLHTYLLYDKDEGINFMGSLPAEWGNAPEEGTFDAYLTGSIEIGNTVIASTPFDPVVHEVIDGNTIVNAESVEINGNVTVSPFPANHTLTVQALQEIHLTPGAHLNTLYPNSIHLRIKKDFYDTPVFDYATNEVVAAFCNNSSAYQANNASRPLLERVEQQIAAHALFEKSKTDQHTKTTLSLYPNPARSELTIQSQGAGIDRLSIFDMATRPVMQASPGGASLYRMDISGLAQGVYIVRAECGGEVLTEKLVVAK